MKDLYFIALVPGEPLLTEIKEIKEVFARDYSSKHALRSPGHITLVPPFRCDPDNINLIMAELKKIADSSNPFDVELRGFASFPPRVIYIKPLKSRSLLFIYHNLKDALSTYIPELIRMNRTFRPHVTVGFRDLSEEMYYKAWGMFKDKEFNRNFNADAIYVLKHFKDGWKIIRSFRFNPDHST